MSLLTQLQTDPTGTLIALLYRVPAVLIALTLHELAHGYVALRCGDPTAQMLGRLTFNPLRHLDFVGTLFMFLFGFGWARPVPVNPRNFRHFRRDDLLVSIAGVVTNFLLFFFATLLMVGVNQWMWKPEMWQVQAQSFAAADAQSFLSPRDFLSMDSIGFWALYQMPQQAIATFSDVMRHPWLLYVQRFLMDFTMINLSLCLFNLLPIPPLDGYHVVNDIFLRGKLHIPARVMNYLMMALLVVCFATDFFSDIISNAIYFVQGGVLSLLLHIFGVA